MSPAELYYFIGQCLSMDDDPEARAKVHHKVSSGNVSWEEFVWMGSSHMVLPALYTAFQRNGLLPLLPPDLEEHLSTLYNLNLSRNRQILEQAYELNRILNSKGIEPVFLKGTGHLLQGLYRDTGERIMSDIDILVAEADIHTAALALYENGYFHPEEFEDDNFENHHHLAGFEHRNRIAMVEIHHSLFPGRYRKLISNAEIETEKRKLHGMEAWVLSYRHQMVLNFVHDQLVDDGYKYKSMVIKGLYDFYLLAKMDYAEKTKPSLAVYKRKFNNYCLLVSATFNHSEAVGFIRNRSAKRFKALFNYLLNHPESYSLYQLIVLYHLRLNEILKLFISVPFSGQSRKYIKKKIGSRDATKRYFQKLKNEIWKS